MTQTAETSAKSSFKLNVKQKNWLVSAHVASGAIWLGTGLCLVIMGVKNVDAPNRPVRKFAVPTGPMFERFLIRTL
jgi:hypothetical protein